MKSWNRYLMGFARHASRKSKDSTKVGAVLVAPDGRTVLLTSYNGPARGVADTPERFERPHKYLFAEHAEANLINTAARHGIRTDGCHVYVTHAPCAACAGSLVQSGIKKVVYDDGKTSMPAESFVAAHQKFEEAGVEFEAY